MKLVEAGLARLERFQGLGGYEMLWQLIPKGGFLLGRISDGTHHFCRMVARASNVHITSWVYVLRW